MKADTYSLATIFGRDVRYVVPLYQRPYVWNEEEHWQPLWEDILWVLGHLSEANGDRPMTHFLGAIVLEQQQTQVGEIDVRTVIDGQQRLTTLQLFLAAASRVADLRQQEAQANLLGGLTRNNQYLAKSRQQQFKVWPTNVNRDAFLAVMAPELTANHGDDPNNRVQEAYAFFFETLKAWSDAFADDATQTSKQFAALTGVARDLLKVVVIDLDPEDNAQAIFETLNARGTPLLAFDLVKNLVFQRADDAGAELDSLYAEEWSEFDTPYWRQEIRQGRLNRARAELFLMHWLTMRRAEAVHAHHLYAVFKRLLETDPEPIAEVIHEFSRDGATYKGFDDQPPGSVPRRFFDQLEVLDTTTAIPIALLLYRDETPPEERDAVLLMLESWLVRRMLCRLTGSGYNRLFVEMLKELGKSKNQPDEAIYSLLAGLRGDSARWPADGEVIRALTVEPVYGRLTQKRVVMILSKLEIDARTALAEDMALPPRLSIEHLMPRSWKKHWPLPDDQVDAEELREAHINRLGNLTLVTDKLNPSLSNSGWAKKRPALNKHSVLLVNRQIVDQNPETWDEGCIDSRSLQLAEQIVRIWPGPGTGVEQWRQLATGGPLDG